MANYYGTGVSNSFLVKDVDALETALENTSFIVDVQDREEGRVSIYTDSDGGFWLDSTWDGDEDEPEDLDVPDMIANHLVDGQVAVFMHTGHEKSCYVMGHAIAVHSSGQQSHLSLDDIYAKAAAEFNISQDGIDTV